MKQILQVLIVVMLLLSILSFGHAAAGILNSAKIRPDSSSLFYTGQVLLDASGRQTLSSGSTTFTTVSGLTSFLEANPNAVGALIADGVLKTSARGRPAASIARSIARTYDLRAVRNVGGGSLTDSLSLAKKVPSAVAKAVKPTAPVSGGATTGGATTGGATTGGATTGGATTGGATTGGATTGGATATSGASAPAKLGPVASARGAAIRAIKNPLTWKAAAIGAVGDGAEAYIIHEDAGEVAKAAATGGIRAAITANIFKWGINKVVIRSLAMQTSKFAGVRGLGYLGTGSLATLGAFTAIWPSLLGSVGSNAIDYSTFRYYVNGMSESAKGTWVGFIPYSDISKDWVGNDFWSMRNRYVTVKLPDGFVFEKYTDRATESGKFVFRTGTYFDSVLWTVKSYVDSTKEMDEQGWFDSGSAFSYKLGRAGIWLVSFGTGETVKTGILYHMEEFLKVFDNVIISESGMSGVSVILFDFVENEDGETALRSSEEINCTYSETTKEYLCDLSNKEISGDMYALGMFAKLNPILILSDLDGINEDMINGQCGSLPTGEDDEEGEALCEFFAQGVDGEVIGEVKSEVEKALAPLNEDNVFNLTVGHIIKKNLGADLRTLATQGITAKNKYAVSTIIKGVPGFLFIGDEDRLSRDGNIQESNVSTLNIPADSTVLSGKSIEYYIETINSRILTSSNPEDLRNADAASAKKVSDAAQGQVSSEAKTASSTQSVSQDKYELKKVTWSNILLDTPATIVFPSIKVGNDTHALKIVVHPRDWFGIRYVQVYDNDTIQSCNSGFWSSGWNGVWLRDSMVLGWGEGNEPCKVNIDGKRIVEIDVSGEDTKTIDITSPIIPSKCPSTIDHSSGISSGNVKNVSC